MEGNEKDSNRLIVNILCKYCGQALYAAGNKACVISLKGHKRVFMHSPRYQVIGILRYKMEWFGFEIFHCELTVSIELYKVK